VGPRVRDGGRCHQQMNVKSYWEYRPALAIKSGRFFGGVPNEQLHVTLDRADMLVASALGRDAWREAAASVCCELW
jgi:hypothetical protein